MRFVVVSSMLLAVAIVGVITGRGEPHLLWLALALSAVSQICRVRDR